MAICPDCAREFYLDEDDLVIGDIVHCEECGVELEVVSLNELELQPASDEDDLEDVEEEDEEAAYEDDYDDEDRYYESDDER